MPFPLEQVSPKRAAGQRQERWSSAWFFPLGFFRRRRVPGPENVRYGLVRFKSGSGSLSPTRGSDNGPPCLTAQSLPPLTICDAQCGPLTRQE